MKDMLATLVRHLVDDPSAVLVNEVATDDSVRYEIRVAAGDVGVRSN